MDHRPRAVGWPSTSVIEWLREQLRNSGHDPAAVPDEPFRIMRLPEVRSKVGLSTPNIYKRMAEGTFPRPIRLDRRSSPAHSAVAA